MGEKGKKEKKEIAIPAAPAASVNYIKSTDKIAQQRNVGRAETLGFYCSNAHQTSPLKLDSLQKYSIHCIRMGSPETSNHNAFREKTRDRYLSIIRRYFQEDRRLLVRHGKSALSFFRTLSGQIWLLELSTQPPR